MGYALTPSHNTGVLHTHTHTGVTHIVFVTHNHGIRSTIRDEAGQFLSLAVGSVRVVPDHAQEHDDYSRKRSDDA